MQIAIRRHILPEISEKGLKRALALTLPALFIYLNVLLFATGGLYLVRLKAPHILGTALFSAERIVDLTNAMRGQNNLPGLSYNPLLASAAAAKAARSSFGSSKSASGVTSPSNIPSTGSSAGIG